MSAVSRATRWRQDNRERYNLYQKEWRRKNRHKSRLFSRATKLKSVYGLTLEDYETLYASLLEKQNGKCALCEKGPDTERYKKLNLDHCHETGRIRGLLCTSCNHSIGRLGDTAESLWRVVKYLTGAGS